MPMSHNFPRAVSLSLVQLQHTLPAIIHMSSCTQVCWVTLPWLSTKVLGSVKITTSCTRRKNELWDWPGNQGIIFPVAPGRCRHWYGRQAKRTVLAQTHAVMVSGTWSPSVCPAQDQLHEARGASTPTSHSFTKSGNELTEPYL